MAVDENKDVSYLNDLLGGSLPVRGSSTRFDDDNDGEQQSQQETQP